MAGAICRAFLRPPRAAPPQVPVCCNRLDRTPRRHLVVRAWCISPPGPFGPRRDRPRRRRPSPGRWREPAAHHLHRGDREGDARRSWLISSWGRRVRRSR